MGTEEEGGEVREVGRGGKQERERGSESHGNKLAVGGSINLSKTGPSAGRLGTDQKKQKNLTDIRSLTDCSTKRGKGKKIKARAGKFEQ